MSTVRTAAVMDMLRGWLTQKLAKRLAAGTRRRVAAQPMMPAPAVIGGTAALAGDDWSAPGGTMEDQLDDNPKTDASLGSGGSSARIPARHQSRIRWTEPKHGIGQLRVEPSGPGVRVLDRPNGSNGERRTLLLLRLHGRPFPDREHVLLHRRRMGRRLPLSGRELRPEWIGRGVRVTQPLPYRRHHLQPGRVREHPLVSMRSVWAPARAIVPSDEMASS